MKAPRLAVLASGGGTTLQNFVDRVADGRLAAEIAVLVASSSSANALERAARAGIPHLAVPWRGRAKADGFSAEITRAVDAAEPDIVCLAGFLRLWQFPDRYAGRVLNIHPALLPAFGGKGMYGRHVHEAVRRAGVRFSGCTVHFATNSVYDEGPIILQRVVPVRFDDTADDIQRRVFDAECEAYPDAVQLLAGGRLRVENGRVHVTPVGT